MNKKNIFIFTVFLLLFSIACFSQNEKARYQELVAAYKTPESALFFMIKHERIPDIRIILDQSSKIDLYKNFVATNKKTGATWRGDFFACARRVDKEKAKEIVEMLEKRLKNDYMRQQEEYRENLTMELHQEKAADLLLRIDPHYLFVESSRIPKLYAENNRKIIDLIVANISLFRDIAVIVVSYNTPLVFNKGILESIPENEEIYCV